MKYYQINRQLFNSEFEGEDGFGKRNPSASIRFLKDKNIWDLFKSKAINKSTLIKPEACLDFFNCEESTGEYLEDYDWILLDGYGLRYESEYSPLSINGWLISIRLKQLLNQNSLILGKEHVYHPAKLRFQDDYLDYFLYQYINYDNDIVDLDQSTVIHLPEGIDDSDPTDFSSYEELKRLIGWYEKAENFKVGLHFKENQDVFNIGLIKGTYASEKFKKIVEDNGITGFEFKPCPHLEITFPPNKATV